jgi:hypothetical protein
MDSRDIFETWAPPGGLWSPWAKPVLFAHLTGPAKGPAADVPEVRLDPTAAGSPGAAIVVDLPGLESIGAGLDLARLGFRPVPLFNGCPAPEFLGTPYDEVVPTTPLLSGLIQGTDRLASAGLPLDAPPAFLLDADRLGTGRRLVPGLFDNRWVVFAIDFPSARLLVERGIVGVQVVHRGRLNDDLMDVLRRWQRGGIALFHVDLQASIAPEPLIMSSAWWSGITRVARRLWSLMSLHRNPAGGFGGFVPEASSSGG